MKEEEPESTAAHALIKISIWASPELNWSNTGENSNLGLNQNSDKGWPKFRIGPDSHLGFHVNIINRFCNMKANFRILDIKTIYET